MKAILCRYGGVMVGFSLCWRSGPICSTNLWRQRKQKHKWIACRQNAAFIRFNMSHRQRPWCGCFSSHVSRSQVERMMDTAPRGHSDIQRYLTYFHMRATASGWEEKGMAGLFLYPLALSLCWCHIPFYCCFFWQHVLSPRCYTWYIKTAGRRHSF